MKKSQLPPLPSSPSEVSDVRRRPLTADELRDIRLLIGRAATGDSGSSGSSGISGGDAVFQPFAGRRVMVPLTSKAFFDGTLSPPRDAASAADSAEVVASATNAISNAPDCPDAAADYDAMRERIYVETGEGRLEEMTRAEADESFERRQRKLEEKKINKKPQKSLLKSAKANRAKSSEAKNEKMLAVNPKKAPATTAPAVRETPTPSENESREPMLPLMEIRETCDPIGNVLRSEVVNVSDTVKRLEDRMKDVEGEEDGKKFGEALARTLKEGAERDVANMTGIADDAELVDARKEEDDEAKLPTTEVEAKKEPISDEEYEALCSRLDELERLEEEDAKSKKENVRSSKKLGGGGWSKGFLNKKPKKRGEKTFKRAAAPKSTFVAPSPAEPEQKSEPASNIPPEKASRVSFSGSDRVKEIPRVGRTKVPRRSAASENSFCGRSETALGPLPGARSVEADSFSPVAAAPFEENVFRGVVKERSAVPRTSEGRNVSGGAGGKKKLSRFAQRRLQGE